MTMGAVGIVSFVHICHNRPTFCFTNIKCRFTIFQLFVTHGHCP